VSLPFHLSYRSHHTTLGPLSAMFTDSGALRSRTRVYTPKTSQGRSTLIARMYLVSSPVASTYLSRLSRLQSLTSSYTNPKYRLDPVHVSISVTFPYVCNLGVERFISTYLIFPVLLRLVIPLIVRPDPNTHRYFAGPGSVVVWLLVHGFGSGIDLIVPVSFALSFVHHCRSISSWVLDRCVEPRPIPS
jgi:hypothetical protein